MDDFRVGSVPSSDPYGNRQPSGSNQRKRQRHQDGEGERQPDDEADTFEIAAGNEDSGEPIEDYYLPSGSEDTESPDDTPV